jgi:GH25 family lysozyme M1 (1,4-beta-N-acetylmuramidase)
MAKIKGMDVSYHQGNIDFKKVVKDGIKFAVIR